MQEVLLSFLNSFITVLTTRMSTLYVEVCYEVPDTEKAPCSSNSPLSFHVSLLLLWGDLSLTAYILIACFLVFIFVFFAE